MFSFNKKSRLANLTEKYKYLMEQATDFKRRGDLRLSYMRLEEADLVAAVINRIRNTV